MIGRPTAAAAGKIDVGGDLTVNRLGFGVMRITGPGIWGDPADRDRAKVALRRAVELDVTFIDTADSYGPEVSENLIAETLKPYPDDLVIATKGGLVRGGDQRSGGACTRAEEPDTQARGALIGHGPVDQRRHPRGEQADVEPELTGPGVSPLLGRRQQIGQDGAQAGGLQLRGDIAVAWTVAAAATAVGEQHDSPRLLGHHRVGVQAGARSPGGRPGS
jgi:hypothetical protein